MVAGSAELTGDIARRDRYRRAHDLLRTGPAGAVHGYGDEVRRALDDRSGDESDGGSA
ncbi:hypothetical protein [Micromonospora sagamiensis]|uniref:Uncharacterized protein n=1 Tax=Micromonospora sagamiensis TaxID=47875 RepID=A0A562WMB4_9ACTN|nr:hypothetical protein [Micromonospora sagamiensis]TWJ31017.1 hypothetical protein JD81_04569 [Micromonospora sagamiensis]BCL15941.1 hypothetical protein GCM10017556_36800 [Micromonospora sagamiensis]